jgi:hypothetical protein
MSEWKYVKKKLHNRYNAWVAFWFYRYIVLLLTLIGGYTNMPRIVE